MTDTPHKISTAGGFYRVCMASCVGKDSSKFLSGVLEVDPENGWTFSFEVEDHGKITRTTQLSTAVRLYNEAA